MKAKNVIIMLMSAMLPMLAPDSDTAFLVSIAVGIGFLTTAYRAGVTKIHSIFIGYLLTLVGAIFRVMEFMLWGEGQFNKFGLADATTFIGYGFLIYGIIHLSLQRKSYSKISDIVNASSIALLFAAPLAYLVSEYIQTDFTMQRKFINASYHVGDVFLVTVSFLLLFSQKEKGRSLALFALSGFSSVLFSSLVTLDEMYGLFVSPSRLLAVPFMLFALAVLDDGFAKIHTPVVSETSHLVQNMSFVGLVLFSVGFAFFPLGGLRHMIGGMLVGSVLLAVIRMFDLTNINNKMIYSNGIEKKFVKNSQFAGSISGIMDEANSAVSGVLPPGNSVSIKVGNTPVSEEGQGVAIVSANSNITIHIEGKPLSSENWMFINNVANLTDIASAAFLQKEDLNEAKNDMKLKVLTKSSSEVAIVVDLDFSVVEASSQAQNYFKDLEIGTKIEDLLDIEILSLSADDPTEVVRHGLFWEITASEIDDSSIWNMEGYVIWLKDVTLRVQAERFDALTGLPNTTAFNKTTLPASGTVCFVNLSNFRKVNESYGYEHGDGVLKAFSERLLHSFRLGKDSIYRGASDDFMVIIPEGILPASVIQERLMNACLVPVPMAGGTLSVSLKATAGVVHFDSEAKHNEIRRQADTALGVAKKSLLEGKNENVVLFEQKFADAAQKNFELELRLRAAAQNGFSADGFEVFFQPIVHADTNVPYAVEALTRWLDDNNKPISFPDLFIPMAEKLGIATELDAWMIEEAANGLKEMQKVFPGLKLQTNLSPVGLTVEKLYTVAEICRSIVPEVSSFNLEVIESTSEIKDLVPTLSGLRDQGFGISIDDYGTGESNMARALNFPATQVKFAGEFADDIVGNIEFLKAQIESMHIQGFEVIVEKVETLEQLEAFRAAGADLIQGWVYAKAMSYSDVMVWLENASNSAPVPESVIPYVHA